MVLDAVRARCDHPSADQIYLDLRFNDCRISRGTVYDVPLIYHSDLDKQAAKKTGYTIERHRTVFEGLCQDCRQKKI